MKFDRSPLSLARKTAIPLLPCRIVHRRLRLVVSYLFRHVPRKKLQRIETKRRTLDDKKRETARYFILVRCMTLKSSRFSSYISTSSRVKFLPNSFTGSFYPFRVGRSTSNGAFFQRKARNSNANSSFFSRKNHDISSFRSKNRCTIE